MRLLTPVGRGRGVATGAARVLTVVAGLVTLLLGLLAMAVRLQPDTGHGEDIGRPLGIAVLLPLTCLAACLGLGVGVGCLAMLRQRGRVLPMLGIALTLAGLTCALLAAIGTPV